MENFTLDPEQRNRFYFQILVEEYEMRAWIGLGKIPNPATNKTEVNLGLAKISIDILEMLEEKTRNNLTEEEQKMLKSKLVNLRLNYAEEYQKQKEAESSKKEQEATEAEKPGSTSSENQSQS